MDKEYTAVVKQEPLKFNRQDALAFAGIGYSEEKIAV